MRQSQVSTRPHRYLLVRAACLDSEGRGLETTALDYASFVADLNGNK